MLSVVPAHTTHPLGRPVVLATAGVTAATGAEGANTRLGNRTAYSCESAHKQRLQWATYTSHKGLCSLFGHRSWCVRCPRLRVCSRHCRLQATPARGPQAPHMPSHTHTPGVPASQGRPQSLGRSPASARCSSHSHRTDLHEQAQGKSTRVSNATQGSHAAAPTSQGRHYGPAAAAAAAAVYGVAQWQALHG